VFELILKFSQLLRKINKYTESDFRIATDGPVQGES
jgi:hypothetical protein